MGQALRRFGNAPTVRCAACQRSYATGTDECSVCSLLLPRAGWTASTPTVFAANEQKPSFWDELLRRLGLLRLPAPVPIPIPANNGVRRPRR